MADKDDFRRPDQERADYAEKKRSMTAGDKVDRERARGAEVAAANAKKFEEAEAEREKERRDLEAAQNPDAPRDAEGNLTGDFERAARGFPHAQPVQPDAGAPVVIDEVTGGVLPKPVGASRIEGQKEQGVPSVQDAAIPSETIEGDAVQPARPDPANPTPIAPPPPVEPRKP